MNPPPEHWKRLDKLVLVAGHAVYVGQDRRVAGDDASWILQSYQKGEPPCYVEHIRFGVELAATQPTALLVFSGGQTRLQAGPKSEAQSYWTLAEQFAWWQKADVRGRSTTEEFARDSFENLLFGLARFRECAGHYPDSMEVIGWEFKRERFDLHRRTLKWPVGDERFKYHGVNNPPDLSGSLKGEAKALEAFKLDPFGAEEPLRTKRERRDPFHRSLPYAATCPDIAALLECKPANKVDLQGKLPWENCPV
jgi:hypothetical protein